jgi:hypothetical protein
MAGSPAKTIAQAMVVDPSSRSAPLKKLVLAGFFDSPVSSKDVVLRIREKFGKRWKTSVVQVYMRRFMEAEIIHAIKVPGISANYWVLSDVAREDALRKIGRGRKVQELEASLFSPTLTSRLERDFRHDLAELQDNFGKHGNCTAFLLRKILEKLIIIVFGKNGKEALLQDKNRPGGWVGLKEMIDTAAREKLGGVPFLIPKTANEIKGIKFLGDTAAHNPLAGVDMNTILPQMPYIITAYEELAARL